ncbi:MAG: hypothetical protein HY680_02160 [Chloroflexi bacterium]|nr:hypothetical protein [Chloroflexota bacterium]
MTLFKRGLLIPLALGLGLAIAGLTTGLGGAPRALAQLPWPTPPPGPIGSFPEVVPANQVTPVAAPATPGSIALQIDPIFQGPVPRIPPRPSVAVSSAESDLQDRVTWEFDAGSLGRTTQLVYVPLPLPSAPGTGQGQTLVRAFRMDMYDTKGAPASPAFKIPVRLTLHPRPQERAASGGDPSRLLVALYEPEQGRWQPLVTNYDPAKGTLLVRTFRPGLYGLLALPAPVP